MKIISNLLWIILIFFSPFTAASDFSEEILKRQIYLDQLNLSPGKIDGINGEFTRVLVSLIDKEQIDAELKERHQPFYIHYKITEADKKFIGKIGATPKQKAQHTFLPYANFAELIAERYHSDRDLLKTINPSIDIETLKVGDVVKVPNVEPFAIELLKHKVYTQRNSKFKDRVIEINTEQHLLLVRENSKILAIFPITPGSDDLPAPKGIWKIVKIGILSWFRYDEKMLNEGKRSETFYHIPPGPNNPIGVAWMSLNKPGIGIHGTDVPEIIGRSESHGCIRMTNWDVIKLSRLVGPGVQVKIDVD